MRTIGLLSSTLLLSFSVVSAMNRFEEPQSKSISFRGATLRMLVDGPVGGRTVLLLHGARFDSGTWLEIGTYQKLAAAGFRVLGLDLPGFGRSEAVDVPREELLAELLPALDVDAPVLVAPSMSGGFALPLLIHHPDAVSGFVAVAPAGVPDYEPELDAIRVPTLIIWGEKDTVIPVSIGERMERKINGSRLIVLEGASHPCYLDRPDEFHQALLDFLKGLRK
jgi:abhydrolase domain-containing protein 14